MGAHSSQSGQSLVETCVVLAFVVITIAALTSKMQLLSIRTDKQFQFQGVIK